MNPNRHLSRRSFDHMLLRAIAFGIFALTFSLPMQAQSSPGKDRVVPAARVPVSSQNKDSADIKIAKVTEKPRAHYTETAKYNGVEGSVRLRVELLASGMVGEITPLSYLSHGLTDQAIAAAKQIRFTPKTIAGTPVDSSVTIEYTFSLYYEDDDPEITTKVEILRMPKPEIDPSELPAAANRRIELKVFFGSSGRASVVNTLSPIPAKLQNAVREAVDRIKFRPAIHRSGKRSGVTKVIVYEF